MTDHAYKLRRTFARKTGAFAASKPFSATVLCFFLGVALATVVMAFVLHFFIFPAMVRESEIREARGTIVTLSQMDKRCLEWRERAEGWMCVRR